MIILGLLVGLIPFVNIATILTGLVSLTDKEFPTRLTDDAGQFHIGAIIGIIICYGVIYAKCR